MNPNNIVEIQSDSEETISSGLENSPSSKISLNLENETVEVI
jgi:hypothetical protein